MIVLLLFLLLSPEVSGQQFEIETLAIFGNRKTRSEIIRRELSLNAGDTADRRDLLGERGWLLRQRLFKRIEFQLRPGSRENGRRVLMVVQEHGCWSVSPILGNNDLFGWYTGGRIHLRNPAGRNTRLSVLAQVGGIRTLGLEWRNPWFGGRARLFAEISAVHLHRPYLYRDYRPSFDFTENTLTISAGRSFGRRLQAGLRASAAQIHVSDSSAGFTPSLTEKVLSAGWFFSFDSRDWPLYPRQGILANLDMRWTGTDAARYFRRLTANIQAYVPVLRNNILAAQTVITLSDGQVPVCQRLHIGGGNTVRGYPTGYAAGTSTLYAGLEYRFPIVYERNPLAGLHAGWAGVLFVDTGTAWFEPGSPAQSDWLLSAGFGIHIIWDSFVLRAEYGSRGKGSGFITTGTSIKF